MTLRRVAVVDVPEGAQPGFDHADVYVGAGGTRMYVAHTGADRVDVFDCSGPSYLRALPGHPGVAGVFVDSERDLLLTTDRAASQLSIYRASDETLVARVSVGPHPNGVALDIERMRAYTFDLGEPLGANCTATVVDLDQGTVVTQIPLPGRPRWAAYDPSTHSVYANIAAPPSIVVIDAEAPRIGRTIEVPSAGPHGLALIGAQLFCATDAGELLVLDPGGVVQTRLPLIGVPDVVMFDRDLARVYIAVGTPGVVHSVSTTSLRELERVPTEPGAHTIGWDPTRKQLWAFAPNSHSALVFQDG